MENTIPNPVDVQNVVDNFEAVVKAGGVKLIAQTDEVKLYRGDDGLEYIYDGSSAYDENSGEFGPMKAQYFGETNNG